MRPKLVQGLPQGHTASWGHADSKEVGKNVFNLEPSLQPQECFQVVQPVLGTPSYTTHSTKPPANSSNSPLWPPGLRRHNGPQPGGILILFPLNQTATSWQKPEWREVFSPLFPTRRLCNNRTQIGKRCESQNLWKSCPDPSLAQLPGWGYSQGLQLTEPLDTDGLLPFGPGSLFPLLVWGGGALRLCPHLWAGGDPPLAQAPGGPWASILSGQRGLVAPGLMG